MEENTVNDVQEEFVEPQTEQVLDSVDSEIATEEVQEDTSPEKVEQSPEENAKYAEIRRKYEAEKAEAVQQAKATAAQEARNQLIAEQYGSQGIKTEQAYKEAVKKQEERNLVREFTARGFDQGQAEQMAKNQLLANEVTKQREQEARVQETKAQEDSRLEKDNNNFLKAFERVNGRPYTKDDVIPQEVWDSVKDGESLTTAYLIHDSMQLRKGTKQQQLNQENANQATGSVKGAGNTEAGPITQKMLDNMSTKEMDKRWTEITKFLASKKR